MGDNRSRGRRVFSPALVFCPPAAKIQKRVGFHTFRHGLILPIGQWVLLEACRQSRAWSDSEFGVMPVAVNVSAVEFQGKDFLSGRLFRVALFCVYNNLTGLRWLRKYFKSRGRQAYLVPRSWAEGTGFYHAGVEPDLQIRKKPTLRATNRMSPSHFKDLMLFGYGFRSMTSALSSCWRGRNRAIRRRPKRSRCSTPTAVPFSFRTP